MAEPSKSIIGAISALAALITAAASLYVALREPVGSWTEAARPSVAESAQRVRERSERLERAPFPEPRDEIESDRRLERAARLAAALRRQPLPGRDYRDPSEELPFLASDGVAARRLAREVVDRYNRTAKEIIDSVGR
ncbi:MAG TPA: hypothetical protein VLE23_12320 [Geminicoccaceae bacterium]|nr:hypothetical protein [Geminicoccaceae bacterium]